ALRAHVESVLAKRCPAPFAPLRPKLNEKIPTGMAELDRFTAGGIPQAELSEICGPASSGRTSLLLALMAEVTSRGELCALADVSPEAARRIPLASWFRFRKAVEHKSTAFVVIENEPHARSCAALVLALNKNGEQWAKLGGEEYSAGTLLREVSCSAAVARG